MQAREDNASAAGTGFAQAGLPNPGYSQRRRIILCFDGTGNKFQGNSADSNILKIYGMLDHDNGDKHYYQPGIGTYVNTRSLSHTSTLSRLNSWYQKAKDSAIGTSFDEHVMGAYNFLMQCYNDDDIFIFGFSRGAYVARFLSEMLDHVGLLSAGNEAMARFAWKAFAQWQEREDNTEEEKKKKQEMMDYLDAFRNTFSRPVRRIRFLGLFDTVNSVPRFENAWMKRSKFPYTARSSAKVIRHAVSIDERRAKFRQDLLSEAKTSRPHERHLKHRKGQKDGSNDNRITRGERPKQDRFRRKSHVRVPGSEMAEVRSGRSGAPTSIVDDNRLDPRGSTLNGLRSTSPAISQISASEADKLSIRSTTSIASFQPHCHADEADEADEFADQDIEELWFPGCHADLGGGWPSAKGEAPLSHGPLVWMIREAQRAGLDFDPDKMLKFKCCDENYRISSAAPTTDEQIHPGMPKIQVTDSPNVSESPDIFSSPHHEKTEPGWMAGLEPEMPKPSFFHEHLQEAFTKGVLHDCLQFNNGLTHSSVLSSRIMEYLPFRRMDLRPDGSWKAISLPLPMGETRDIPENALVHHSAIRRMEANPNYRPGNLIIGGGGRGIRRAPDDLGTGKWKVLKGKGDVVGCVMIREGPSPEKQRDEK